MKRNQSGFTLIEIAIVLVIIGLLLGGVLKGQELINSAKVKSFATDFRNIPVFIYGYQDKFRALPGDDAAVAAHASGTVAATVAGSQTPGNGLIEGNWNSYTKTDESYLFWQHIRLANLATGTTVIPGTPVAGDGYRPLNAAGGEIGIQSASPIAGSSPAIDSSGNPIRGTYIVCSPNILGKFAKQLDLQMDDGQTNTGAMLTIANNGALGSAAVASPADATVYTVCMGI
jgi:prepilin-type N-terminal cleavage/methylation domain-containing protein